MKRTTLFFSLGIVFLFLFYGLSVMVKKEMFKQVNFDFTVRLQDNIPTRLDGVWEDFALLVSPAMSVLFVGLLTIYNFLLSTRTTPTGIGGETGFLSMSWWKARRWGAFLIPFFFSLMIGAEIYGKAKVESPAPPFVFLKNPTTIFPTYHVQDQYSYPSGHAARALFLSGMFLTVLPPRAKRRSFLFLLFAFCILLSIVISIGKVYLGHHWLTDILGGWTIALSFLFFTVPFSFPGTSKSG